MIEFNSNLNNFKLNLQNYQSEINHIHQHWADLLSKKIPENMLDWINSPDISSGLLQEIIDFGKIFAQDIQVLVIIGIGGSFSGIKAALDWLLGRQKSSILMNLFAGRTLNSSVIHQLLRRIGNRKFGICVISKSGNTIEPLVSLNILAKILKQKFGQEFYRQHVVAITSKQKGKLFTIAQREQWKVFDIPLGVGGRFSVLSAVGLVPLAINQIDICRLLSGARQAKQDTHQMLISKNSAYQYALVRWLMFRKKFVVEAIVTFEQTWSSFMFWAQQIFAESEGKRYLGLLPIACVFTRDLHSLEQYFKEGTRNVVFEVISHPLIHDPKILISDQNQTDVVHDLPAVSIDEVNQLVFRSLLESNQEKQVPTFVLKWVGQQDPVFLLGYFFYWYMRACLISASLLKVNPLNQPGVETYKSILRNHLQQLQ